MNALDLLLETPALIELEGLAVLTFVAREDVCAIYNIIGFNENPLITMVDYRQKGLETIDTVLSSKQVTEFPENFCFPAQVRIFQSRQEILIELFDLESNFQPELMLWIATDLDEPIPDYEYSFLRIKPKAASTYSCVSLFNYHRFQAYFDGIVHQTFLQLRAEI